MHRRRTCKTGRSQRGAALWIVMIALLLATLLVVGGARTAWFSERLVSTDADHERALANAQALLADAEFDIRGETPDGQPCMDSAHAVRPTGHAGDGCRASGDAAPQAPWIPRQGRLDFLRLRALLSAHASDAGIACGSGICLPDALPQDFWTLPPEDFNRIVETGARYAQFSGAPGAPQDNPLLSNKGWYWIEVLPYAGPMGTALAPDADNPFLFRITALAQGHRASTQVVLQRLLVWKRVDS